MNSQIYCSEEANNYYLRNAKHSHSYFIDYLLSLFPKRQMRGFDIAEFGIGNGANLLYLKEFCGKAHGYEASDQAIGHLSKILKHHPNADDFYLAKVNLAEPFSSMYFYDLIIYGFFPYYCDDEEMRIVMENTIKVLKRDCYIFLFDFLTRKAVKRTDSRNSTLFVYKRPLPYWLDFFNGFDLMDFRLFDSRKIDELKNADVHSTIDTDVSADDGEWVFSGLWRRRLDG